MGILETIYNAVLGGKVEDAAEGVQAALKEGMDVDDVLDKGLIAAMDLVGERFGEGEIFIPQVLWSAKAMQAGVDLLRPHLGDSSQKARGKVVIGTAKGDIHDIGKNLVAMMLEGAGLTVIDLGVDVASEQFVDRAAEEEADIIAISALLTTTMVHMGEVVGLLKEKNLQSIKVMVGGAPLSESFCREIGAHAYGVDASDAVQRARELLGHEG